MTRRLLFLASLFLLIRSSHTDTFSKTFHVELGLSDNGHASFSTRKLPSVTACVITCLSQSGCLAVVYHNTTMVCSFLDSTATVLGTLDTGYSFVFVGDHCMDDWIEFGGACYLFGQHAYTWQEARIFCQSLGASLVEIETASENVFIQETLSNIANQNHWIGMTDVDQEDVWVWASGAIANYIDWGTDQPNNGIFANCGAIWQIYNYQWVDESCSESFYPICEQSPTTDP